MGGTLPGPAGGYPAGGYPALGVGYPAGGTLPGGTLLGGYPARGYPGRVPPSQVRTGEYPAGGYPVRTTEGVLTTRWAVCRLRSRRRTFLFFNLFSIRLCWEVEYFVTDPSHENLYYWYILRWWLQNSFSAYNLIISANILIYTSTQTEYYTSSTQYHSHRPFKSWWEFISQLQNLTFFSISVDRNKRVRNPSWQAEDIWTF